jgi:hypothetical protein
VRVIFVLLTGLTGAGVLLYVALWAVLPAPLDTPAPQRRRLAMAAYAALGLGGMAVSSIMANDGDSIDASAWPAVVVVAGVCVIRHLIRNGWRHVFVLRFIVAQV